MALVIGVVATILSTIYSYILMGIIDTELIDKLRIVAEEKITNNPKIPENYYDIAMERLDKQFTLNRMLIMGSIGGTVIYAIIGLIAAAFIKKEESPADMAL